MTENVIYILFSVIIAMALLIVIFSGLKNLLEFSFVFIIVMFIFSFIIYNNTSSSIEKNGVKVFASIVETKKYKNYVIADVYIITDISEEDKIKGYDGEKLKIKLDGLKHYSEGTVIECMYNTKNENLIPLEEFNMLNMTLEGKIKLVFLNVVSNIGIKSKNMSLDGEENNNIKSVLMIMFCSIFVFTGIWLFSTALKESTKEKVYEAEAKVIEITETRRRSSSGRSRRRTVILYTPIYEYEHKGQKYTFEGVTRNFGIPEIGETTMVSLDKNGEVFTKESIVYSIIAGFAFGGMGFLMLILFFIGAFT